MKIAIFVDKFGRVLPFFSTGVVEVYSDESGYWKCIRQVPMVFGSEPSMNEVLRNVRMLISEFDGCDLLVVENVQGIANSYLSDFHIGVWKFKGLFLDESLLNHIKQEVGKAIAEQEQNRIVAAPTLVGKEEDAVYELDLATLIDCDASLSSKSVLIPFLQSVNFRELIIICRQSPKWLEQSMELFQLSSIVDEMGDGILCLTLIPIDFNTGLEIRKSADTTFINSLDDSCSSFGCNSVGVCAPQPIGNK